MKYVINSAKILLGVFLLSIIMIAVTEAYRILVADKVDDGIEYEETIPTKNSTTSNSAETLIPEKAILDVPFSVQAPNANWDELHEEACEETSLIMLNHFIKKTKVGSANDIDNEIHSLIDFENSQGYKVDVTLDELNSIAKSYFQLSTGRVETNISVEDIKKEIAEGRPVIIPAAGRLLDNPNFSGEGPIYHMLVIKGYDKEGFITNDPGTRKGDGFRYSYSNLFDAIHDWNSEDILRGAKRYLVFD